MEGGAGEGPGSHMMADRGCFPRLVIPLEGIDGGRHWGGTWDWLPTHLQIAGWVYSPDLPLVGSLKFPSGQD